MRHYNINQNKIKQLLKKIQQKLFGNFQEVCCFSLEKYPITGVTSEFWQIDEGSPWE
jgi:hypothetical protein